MTEISIIICCYNSALRLPKTLEHIALLERDNVSVEVMVIDNASKDGTGEAANKIWDSLKGNAGDIRFSVIEEPEPGLSAARKRGIIEAKGDYLIFVDDDNWLNKNFLSKALQLFKAYPKGGVFGGLGIPCFETGVKPDWFDPFQSAYAVGVQGETDGDVTQARGFVFGASSIWKKSILDTIILEPFLLTDRLGAKLTSGGDSELCFKAVIQGYQIIYSKDLIFTHFIPKERLTKGYVNKMMKDSYAGNIYLHGLMYKAGINPTMFNKKLKRVWAGQILFSIGKFMRGRISFYTAANYVYHYSKLNKKYNALFK